MKARVLVVDNYDSFTFNLVQALRGLDADVIVRRNDAVAPADVDQLGATHLLVSPGPGRPEEAGASMAMIEELLGRLPILGVCLGHQALCRVLGAKVVRGSAVVHGKASRIFHDGRGLLRGLRNPFEAGRYHSLCVEESSLPAELEVSAWEATGVVLAVRHTRFAADGLQFHPESVLTPLGETLLKNFLSTRRAPLEVKT